MIARLKATLMQMLCIVLFGIGAGLAGNRLSPRGLPVIPPPKVVPQADGYLALDQAKALWHSGTALFLDARQPADYAAGHIGNALNLPAQSFAQYFVEVAPLLSPDSKFVLYCDGPECELSHRLREHLRQHGFTNTHLLFNGWSAWRQAGLPTGKGGPR